MTARATACIAHRLRVAERTVLLRERVELLDPDGRPAVVMTTWRRGRQQPHVSFHVEVSTRYLDRSTASLLGLAVGMLVLVVERTRYDAQGRPVETTDLTLPADRWRIGW